MQIVSKPLRFAKIRNSKQEQGIQIRKLPKGKKILKRKVGNHEKNRKMKTKKARKGKNSRKETKKKGQKYVGKIQKKLGFCTV